MMEASAGCGCNSCGRPQHAGPASNSARLLLLVLLLLLPCRLLQLLLVVVRLYVVPC
jgi:hypothetical protein